MEFRRDFGGPGAELARNQCNAVVEYANRHCTGIPPADGGTVGRFMKRYKDTGVIIILVDDDGKVVRDERFNPKEIWDAEV